MQSAPSWRRNVGRVPPDGASRRPLGVCLKRMCCHAVRRRNSEFAPLGKQLSSDQPPGVMLGPTSSALLQTRFALFPSRSRMGHKDLSLTGAERKRTSRQLKENRINKLSRPFSKHASVKSEMSHNSLSICDDMTVEGHDNEGQHRECFFGRRVQHARKFCGLGWYQTPARAQIASHTVGCIGDNDHFWPVDFWPVPLLAVDFWPAQLLARLLTQTNRTVLLTTPPNLG